MTRCQVGLW